MAHATDTALLRTLNRVYHPTNSVWDPDLAAPRHAVPDDIGAADLDALDVRGLRPNQHERHDHDATLDALLSLQPHPCLTLDFGAACYLAGLSGALPPGRHGGRQVLLDILRLRALTAHTIDGSARCAACGLEASRTVDITLARTTSLRGHASNEGMNDVLPRLTWVLDWPDPAVARADIDRLFAVLAAIADAAPDETPGKLQARLAKTRLLPKTDGYKRVGLLQTLAELGVLPNPRLPGLLDRPRTQAEFIAAHTGLPGSGRSDIVLPLAAWRGRDGVDLARARKVFDLPTPAPE